MNFKALVILIATMMMACTKKPTTGAEPCGSAVIIDENLYDNVNTTNYNITKAVINENCLQISFASSGCSGNTWTVDLVASPGVAQSNPPQRMIKLKLTNNELCTAVVTKTKSFNIAPLKVSGTTKLILGLAGFSGPLLYQY